LPGAGVEVGVVGAAPESLPGFVGDSGVDAGAGAGAGPASAPSDDGGGEGGAAGAGFSQTSFEWSSSTGQFQAAPPAGLLVGLGTEARVQRQLPAISSQLQPAPATGAPPPAGRVRTDEATAQLQLHPCDGSTTPPQT